MERIFIGIVLLALLLVLVFSQFDDPEPRSAMADAAPEASEDLLGRLRDLELKLDLAQARLSDIEALLPPSDLAPATASMTALPDEAANPEEEEAAPAPAQSSRDSRTLARIEEAGLTQDEFEVLETRAYELYLENFEQEWLQRREAYLGAERLPSSRERLREELGDEAYDRYLYANGSANRVRVRRVLPGSAAQLAGLRDGDLILSYDGRRLFNFDDLRRASYEGSPGESVTVDVRRPDGTIMQLTLPRGPMGISGQGGARSAPGS